MAGETPPPNTATTKTRPIAPQRFALQVTIDQATHDKLVRAQALLRHRVPSGDLAQVLDRALDALLDDLTHERFAAIERPRAQPPRDASSDPRQVPAAVQRAVHARDGEQCTFVHVTPVAVGGQPTIDGIRMLCRSHNQYEAERILGAEIVRAGRQRSRMRVRDESPVMSPPSPQPQPTAPPPTIPSFDADTFQALRTMGVTIAQARDALARSAHAPADTIEQRIRAALRALRTTYASRCSEPHSLVWGWSAIATPARSAASAP